MQREILFRGKSTGDMGQWVYGYYNYDDILREHFIADKDSLLRYEVREETIGQYIGMTDKNDIKIFDGDIGEIKTQSGRVERFLVKWGIHQREMKSGWLVDVPSFCFEINGFPSFPIVNNYQNGHDLDIITIIGTIHDNPELIKQ